MNTQQSLPASMDSFQTGRVSVRAIPQLAMSGTSKCQGGSSSHFPANHRASAGALGKGCDQSYGIQHDLAIKKSNINKHHQILKVSARSETGARMDWHSFITHLQRFALWHAASIPTLSLWVKGKLIERKVKFRCQCGGLVYAVELTLDTMHHVVHCYYNQNPYLCRLWLIPIYIYIYI